MTSSPNADHDIEQASLLLQEYSFDLGGYSPTDLLALWQAHLEADASWIRAAVVEALYQGRYKAFSVEQILRMWKRRGAPIRHFNHDFERMVLGPIDPTLQGYIPPSGPWHNAPSAPSPAPEPLPLETPPLDPPALDPVADPWDTPTPATPSPSPWSGTTEAPKQSTPFSLGMIAAGKSKGRAAQSMDSPPQSSAGDPGFSPYREDVFSQPLPIQKFVPMAPASGFYHRLERMFDKD